MRTRYNPRAAAIIGQVDQQPRDVSIKTRLHHARELIAFEIIGKPVGAQHEAIAGLHRDGRAVDLDLVLEAHRARDDVAELRLLRLFLGHHAGAHLLGHPTMIVGELLHATVATQVGTAVAHVREVGAAALEPQRRERGAHAVQLFVGLRGLKNRRARGLRGFAEDLEGVAALGALRLVGADLLHQGLERELAGALAALVSAHAVGHRVQAQRVLDEEAVLVVVALLADVAERVCEESHETSAPT
jgi:hypothetical protein